jgi:hypothetical protein
MLGGSRRTDDERVEGSVLALLFGRYRSLATLSDLRGSTLTNASFAAPTRVLAALGIGVERLVVSSEGSEGATGSDETGWQQDRRVDDRALSSVR